MRVEYTRWTGWDKDRTALLTLVGESRVPNVGEWYLDEAGEPARCFNLLSEDYQILRLVEN